MIHRKALIDPSTVVYHSELSNIGDCRIGKNCKIHSNVWIGDGVTIGDRCKVQAFVFIPPGVTIQDDVFIGPGVIFTNDKYPPSDEWGRILVMKGVSIGAGAIILPNITLWPHCRIGAGAVVTKSVMSGETVVGNPARPM